jgi:hypothetical protein
MVRFGSHLPKGGLLRVFFCAVVATVLVGGSQSQLPPSLDGEEANPFRCPDGFVEETTLSGSHLCRRVGSMGWMCPKVGYTKVHSSWCRCGDVVHNNSLADHLCTDVLYP